MDKTALRRIAASIAGMMVLGVLVAGCSKPEEAPAPAPKGAEVLPDKGMNPGSPGISPVSGKKR